MPIAAINAYLERLPARIAELKLAMADAASIPHMKKSDRESTLKSWKREVEKYRGSSVVSPGRLKLLGIGVKRGE